jgi:hypothetical protein
MTGGVCDKLMKSEAIKAFIFSCRDGIRKNQLFPHVDQNMRSGWSVFYVSANYCLDITKSIS